MPPALECLVHSTSARSAENCSGVEYSARASSPSACLPPPDANSEMISRNLPPLELNSARFAVLRPRRSPRSLFLPIAPTPELENTPDKHSLHRATPAEGCPFLRNPRSRPRSPPEPSPPPLWNGTLPELSPRLALLPPTPPCPQSRLPR